MNGTDNRLRLADAGRGRPLRAVPEDAMAGDITALRAELQVEALGVEHWPPYGTPEWLKLNPRDPRCYAAMLEAAERHRRAEAEQDRLDRLMDHDPDAWYREITAQANAEAARIAPALARRRTNSERDKAWRDMFKRAERDWAERRARLAPNPNWPPVAVPGQAGRPTGQETTE